MPKKPFNQIPYDQEFKLKNDEIECAFEISQAQLNCAKIYSNREEYINSLPKNIDYMELGVAWGYYSELIAEQTSPASITLVDWYNQDLKCWSWRKFGSCQCEGIKHELLYLPETHEQYIQDKFKDYNFAGSALSTLLDVLTYNTQYNAFYLNMVANEMFMDTALQRPSVVSHAKFVGCLQRNLGL